LSNYPLLFYYENLNLPLILTITMNEKTNSMTGLVVVVLLVEAVAITIVMP